MKGTTVRSHTLGISVGNPLSIETALDVFNDTAFESIDFAITAARVYGLKVKQGHIHIRLFITSIHSSCSYHSLIMWAILSTTTIMISIETSQYNYFNGGKYQFIGWHGIPFSGTGANITPPDVGAFFFNTTAIVDSFKRYVSHLLSVSCAYFGHSSRPMSQEIIACQSIHGNST